MIGNPTDSVEYSLSESACQALRIAAVERVRRARAARLSSNRRTDAPADRSPACGVTSEPPGVPILDSLSSKPPETGRGDRGGTDLA